jgi:hypothetical protein
MRKRVQDRIRRGGLDYLTDEGNVVLGWGQFK